MKKIKRQDIFNAYIKLYGMPYTIERAELLLRELQEGLREIWGYFRDRKVGPPYMVQQPEPESYYKNRIIPMYEHDRRDFVRIVYTLFPYILLELFRSVGQEDFPDKIFYESEQLTGPPVSWARRYHTILKLIPQTRIPLLVASAFELYQEIQDLYPLSVSNEE